MHNIAHCWGSIQDYILSTVFYKPTSVDPVTGKLVVDATDIEGQVRFEKNEFPYQLTEGGNHSVLWLGPTPSGALPTEDDINVYITSALRDCTRAKECVTEDGSDQYTKHDDQFDFVWYENPKMTVPLVYHLQVFWCHLPASNDGAKNNQNEGV